MTNTILGFSQIKLTQKYNLELAETLVLRFIIDWMGADFSKLSAEEIESYISPNMEHIQAPNGKTYHWLSIKNIQAQLPILGYSQPASISKLIEKLTGNFDKAKDIQYPLEKFLSSKSGERKVYVRITPTILDLMSCDGNMEAQRVADSWNRKEQKPRTHSFLDDKLELSDSFLSLYREISQLYSFKHQLPKEGQAPSKTLLDAQCIIDEVLSGEFITKYKFSERVDTSVFSASKEAILSAIKSYGTWIVQNPKYKHSLVSFFYNPKNGSSMFLSLLAANKYTKKALSKAELKEKRENSSKKVQNFLTLVEESTTLRIDEATIENAEKLAEWHTANAEMLAAKNDECAANAGSWKEFREVFVQWLGTWKSPSSNLLSVGTKTWALFKKWANDRYGWSLTVTASDKKKVERDEEEFFEKQRAKEAQEEANKRRRIARELGIEDETDTLQEDHIPGLEDLY